MGALAPLTEAEDCRICGRRLPAPFLDLGAQPLANDYLPAGADPSTQARYPLAVAACEGCGMVQLTHTVEPAALFSEYSYFSSHSESFLQHAERMAEALCSRLGLGAGARVVELGSNDGYLLQYFLRRGLSVLGFEPAGNIARVASERGIPTFQAFFGADAPARVEAELGHADLVIGNNVLAHVPSVVVVLDAARRSLRPGGLAVFEVPYLLDLLAHVEFDTVYHEHLHYFSGRSLVEAGARAGLELVDVERQPVHGGSLRAFFAPAGAPVSPRVSELLAVEKEQLLPERLHEFGGRVRGLCASFRDLLLDLRAAGRTIGAYGAPAKAGTLLNAAGITSREISFTVDRAPSKQGRLLPGSGIPIHAPEKLLELRPDYAVLLVWNLRAEVEQQQAPYLAAGGRFIVPIPELTVVGGARS